MIEFEYVQEFWINELKIDSFKNAIKEMRFLLSQEPKEVRTKYKEWKTDDKMIIRYAMATNSKFDKEGKKLAN